MSLLRRAAGVDDVETRSDLGAYGLPGAGKWETGMRWSGYGGMGGFGASNRDRAVQLSAVYGCWRILSEGVGTLPLDAFDQPDAARGVQFRRPASPPDYLRFVPPAMSRIVYLSMLVLSLCSDGNAFVATPRLPDGEPMALIPLDPLRVEPHYNAAGQLRYSAAGVDDWSPWDIMHIPGMMMPGSLRGISPLKAARMVVESGLSAQEFGANLWHNSAVPPAVIEIPALDSAGAAQPKDQTNARKVAETWHETHGGVENAGKIGVLIGGAKLSTVAITPEDAQWLDGKRFGVSEVARFYGVPPHLIADASNSTSWGSGLAEQNTAFGSFGLRPYCERIEDGHNRLLYTHGRGSSFVKLNLDAVLRAAPKDRWSTYNLALASGTMTINEVRALEDLAPVAWGAEPFIGPGHRAPQLIQTPGGTPNEPNPQPAGT